MSGAESCHHFVPAKLTKMKGKKKKKSLSVLFTELQDRQSLLKLQLMQKLPCSFLTITFTRVPEQAQD